MFYFSKAENILFENQNAVLNQNFSFQIRHLYNRKRNEKNKVFWDLQVLEVTKNESFFYFSHFTKRSPLKTLFGSTSNTIYPTVSKMHFSFFLVDNI